jgi:hypothetical protein
MVLRSTPVRRAISCWLVPRSSSVAIVIRKCDFKTFNSSAPPTKGKQRKRPAAARPAPLRRRRLTSGVGEFQVATDGGVWVAAGGRENVLDALNTIEPRRDVSEVPLL